MWGEMKIEIISTTKTNFVLGVMQMFLSICNFALIKGNWIEQRSPWEGVAGDSSRPFQYLHVEWRQVARVSCGGMDQGRIQPDIHMG